MPGGFTMPPDPHALEQMQGRLVGLRDDLKVTIDLFQTISVPQFERPTEYVSLRRPDCYAFYGGEIVSSEGTSVPAERYREALNEFIVPHSTAKHSKWNLDSYMVGALARVNNNWQQLVPEARAGMEALGLKPPCHNPFMITVAQVVELIHCVEDSIAVIDQVLGMPLAEEWEPEITPRAGQGVGLAEAPRGLLMHDYTYDDQGRCTNANCIIPTAQNFANIDADLKALLLQLADRPKDEIELHLEMLVRAYDPCISCSVH
jgi:coenzyme F420-reducing hydrogenase alpha subunit